MDKEDMGRTVNPHLNRKKVLSASLVGLARSKRRG